MLYRGRAGEKWPDYLMYSTCVWPNGKVTSGKWDRATRTGKPLLLVA